MKKHLLASIVLLVLILNSCGDIVDSENNVNKTKITYNYVKLDQEHSVIMPLKVGNKWIYKVTDYNPSGIIQKEYLDSIVVNEEVQINGEQWFKVKFPLINENNDLLMTNTDVGLLYKCDICSDIAALLALYPVTSKEYISNSHKNMYMVVDANGKPISEGSIKVISRVTIQSPIQILYGSKLFDGILYKIRDQYEENPNLYTVNTYEYNFVSDYGLFEAKIYRIPNEQITFIEKTYELIKYSGLLSNEIIQNVFEYDYSQIALGNSQTLSKINVLTNNSDSTLEIMSTIFSANCNIRVWLNPSKYLNPGDNLEVRIEITPRQVGDLNGKVTIQTNKGSFDIMIKGTVI
jgi:hypothetical protein